MEIAINKTIVVQEEIKKNITSIKVIQLTDTLDSVIATIALDSERPMNLILWEGEGYAEIGQWTDEDVKKRIIEMI